MGRIGRSIVAIVAFAMILPLGSIAAAGGIGIPGSDGIGDGYFPLTGNGGYDVGHYDLDIRYAPATDMLFGHVTIEATATQALSRFDLDLDGLKVRSITVGGVPATWTREQGQELVVTPATGIPDASAFTVVVDYDGVPKSPISYGARAGAVRTDDGVLIYGEPDVAAYWFPSNDHPRDKATFTIDLTAPKGLKAISNGRLLGHADAGHDRVTWSWDETTPMATYLAMAVIGKFKITRRTTQNGVKVLDAVDPRVGLGARRSLAKEPRVIRFLEGRFGAYPFMDLGGIVDKWPGGFALENQTRPIYPPNAFRPNRSNTYLIVHELAHQWFGDSVSVDEWQHLWLNEGFATYAEWLWYGAHTKGTPQQLLGAYCGIGKNSPFWDRAPGDPGVEHLFAGQVYTRGAMTLQALRKTVGTASFFQILQTWVDDHTDSTGSTAQFVALSEAVSGQDLDAFFDEWLFATAKPQPCVVGGPSRHGNDGRLLMPAPLRIGRS